MTVATAVVHVSLDFQLRLLLACAAFSALSAMLGSRGEFSC